MKFNKMKMKKIIGIIGITGITVFSMVMAVFFSANSVERNTDLASLAVINIANAEIKQDGKVEDIVKMYIYTFSWNWIADIYNNNERD